MMVGVHVHAMMNTKILRAVVAVAAIACVTANAGLQIDVAQSGIAVFGAAVVDIVNTNFSSMAIPDISISEKVPVIGSITFTLSNIQVYGVHVGSAAVNLAAPSAAGIAISGADASIRLDFHYRKNHWPHVSGHGTVTVSAQDGNFDVNTVVSIMNNLPHLHATGSSATFSKFDIHFSGHDKWIYNLLVKLFKGTINKVRSFCVGFAACSTRCRPSRKESPVLSWE